MNILLPQCESLKKVHKIALRKGYKNPSLERMTEEEIAGAMLEHRRQGGKVLKVENCCLLLSANQYSRPRTLLSCN